MSLVNTLTQPLREKYVNRLDKNEDRSSRYGALTTFIAQTASGESILSDEVQGLIKQSFGNTVEIPVIDADTVTIGNTRSCTVVDSENTSQIITLSFTTYAWGFSMVPAQHYNNDVKYQQDFERKFKRYWNQFQADLDTQCINQMETDKNQFFPASLTGAYYPEVGGAMQVPQTAKEDFYNQLGSIMQEMDFYDGGFDIVHNPKEAANVRRYAAQGSGNATNLAFQLPGYDYSQTNRITNGLGVESTLYAFQQGSVAIQNRNDADSILGSKVGDVIEWDEVTIPLEDGGSMLIGSKYSKSCADESAKGGGASEASLREEFQFSTDVVTITAYNSDPVNTYSPVVKFEIMQ